MCTGCGVERPRTFFHSAGSGYLASQCKDCINTRRRTNGYGRRKHLRQYGITPGDYDDMHKKQDGRCAICGASQALVVDHCHTTGAVRGLLCQPCNLGLGQFSDIPERLRQAAMYLEVHSAVTTAGIPK